MLLAPHRLSSGSEGWYIIFYHLSTVTELDSHMSSQSPFHSTVMFVRVSVCEIIEIDKEQCVEVVRG